MGNIDYVADKILNIKNVESYIFNFGKEFQNNLGYITLSEKEVDICKKNCIDIQIEKIYPDKTSLFNCLFCIKYIFKDNSKIIIKLFDCLTKDYDSFKSKRWGELLTFPVGFKDKIKYFFESPK